MNIRDIYLRSLDWLIDDKARGHLRPYLLQSLLATFSILLILLFLDVIEHTALIATLGSTVFLVFANPNAYAAHTRPLIGGYLVGIGVGALFYYFSLFPEWLSLPVSKQTIYVVYAAMAVGVAILIMVLTDTEHPPAAGAALGLVLNSWSYQTLIFMLAAVLSLALLRSVLRRYMVDLM